MIIGISHVLTNTFDLYNNKSPILILQNFQSPTPLIITNHLICCTNTFDPQVAFALLHLGICLVATNRLLSCISTFALLLHGVMGLFGGLQIFAPFWLEGVADHEEDGDDDEGPIELFVLAAEELH